MQNSITISKSKPEDAGGIIDLLYKTWLATYPNKEHGITTEDIEESYSDARSAERISKLEDRIRNIPPNELRLTAKSGEKIVGVARMIKHEDNNQLQMMYVLPEFQGKGIGKMLFAKSFEFVDGHKNTIVQVVTYNTQAIKFYEKLGFEDNGRRFTEERFRMKGGNIMPEMEMVLKSCQA